MEFRKDINGLRAVAVLAVMFYHFGIHGFSGGFSGVDVFFVISGYLMTGIILTKMAERRFSLVDFYLSRVKRIVPALAVLCVALLAVGWFWIPPVDYEQLGEHAASAIVFASNFTFKGEDGYFDTSALDKWLLHTWSLSVEWQFYLLYPLFLSSICRRRSGPLPIRRVQIILGVVATASFALSIALSPSSTAFYLLPTRMWELVAGGLVFLCGHRTSPQSAFYVQSAGLALILVGIMAFDSFTAWPGSAASVPVIGAVLLIWNAVPHSRVLANGLMQRIGAWSYSIYLWHWPVIVALRQAHLHEKAAWLSLGIILSITLGFLSFSFVETPVRQARILWNSRRRSFLLATATAILVAVSGLTIYAQNGRPQRVSPAIRVIESVIAESRDQKPVACDPDEIISAYPACRDETPSYVVWGDSHAAALFGAVREASGDRYGHLYHKSCPPLINGYIDSKKRRAACAAFTNKALEQIGKLPSSVPLLIVFRFSYYLHGYNEHVEKPIKLRYLDIPDSEVEKNPDSVFSERLVQTLCKARTKGHTRPVYVLQPIPEIGIDVPRTLSRQMMFQGRTTDITLPLAKYRERHQTTMAALQRAHRLCGVELLDPVPYLCPDGGCLGSENGLPLYFDDDHLSRAGGAKIVPLFQKLFPAVQQ